MEIRSISAVRRAPRAAAGPGAATPPTEAPPGDQSPWGNRLLAVPTTPAPGPAPGAPTPAAAVPPPPPALPAAILSPSRPTPATVDGWHLAGLPAAHRAPAGYDPADLDPSVRPQDDFYQYAVGGYLKRHPIPDDQAAWGSDGELKERIEGQLKGILEEASLRQLAPPGSIDRQLGDFYASGMDTAAVDKAGLHPLDGELARIASVRDRGSLADAIAHLHAVGINAVFSFGPEQDARDANSVIGGASQGGLTLPDRDYYFKNDGDTRRVRDAFVAHVARTFALMGDDPAIASARAAAVLAVETKLAAGSKSAVDQRDPWQLYHPTDGAGLKALAPGFDWERYFAALGSPDTRRLNVDTPDFFRQLDTALRGVSLDDWKTYLTWQLVSQTAPYLPAPFEREDFRFSSGVLQGVHHMPPRWQRVVEATDAGLGEALGQQYVARCFSPEAKARAQRIVDDIKAALRDRIAALDWMSPQTKQEALAKVDSMVTKVGYPEHWRDCSGLAIDRGPYAANVLRAKQFAAQDALAMIGKPVDRSRWGMTAPTVNAYYNAPTNEIVIPAGILQPPYFDVHADPAANYGAIGSVVGHEITHGFDDEGSQYDAKGNLRDWWQPADRARFQARGDGVARQFDGFVYDGQRTDGKLVEGESLADLGGMELAHAAFERASRRPGAVPPQDGFTPEQRFFLRYARTWPTSLRPEFAHLQLSTNPHPLPRFRVNGPLSNMPAFQRAFHVQPGDPMQRPAGVRNHLWDP